MANLDHVNILRRGVGIWNGWRADNKHINPDLSNTTFSAAALEGADLSDSNLTMAYLRRADLAKANLVRADLTKADLSYTELQGANLKEAILSETNISYANLRNANLFKAYLTNADLRSSELYGTSFIYSDLTDSVLTRARLFKADLSFANLTRADLSWAMLYHTALCGGELTNANFNFASMSDSIFGDVDLSNVENLESIIFYGPVTIGINTVYKSEGKIPEVFLRGCGVPENFITYMKSLTMEPFEYYSCFISHSTKDAEFAERLYSDLQNKAVRCWYAPEDMKGGKKLYPQIDEAIRVHDKLVLILSESSIDSPWVATEIRRTRKYERQEGRQRLFPISLIPYQELREWELFDADLGTDLAAEIRSYFIPDFSNWKDHDSYKKAFDKLLKDLKAAG